MGEEEIQIHGNMETMTLDEPIIDTVKRDLKMIGLKLKCVLLPGTSEDETLKELRNWDLWGPLLMCLTLSVIMTVTSHGNESAFTLVFVIVWCGAFVVTLNAQLLGGKISCFQSVCVLGYCIFPLVVAAFFCALITNIIFKSILVPIGFLWSTKASVVFMSQLVKTERKVLATYPVFLFYIVIAWMIYIS